MVGELTAQETYLIDNAARAPAELPVDMSWLPVTQVSDALTYKDYTLIRTAPGAGSLMGETSYGVATAKAETERNFISFRAHYLINKTELRMAQRSGYDIIAMNSKMIRSNMQLQLAKLVLQGSDAEWRVNISGMLDVGEDVDATLDAILWDTATKPLVHVAAGFSDLKANYFAPPYDMILSSNLQAGFLALNNAANPRSHQEIAVATYLQGGSVYFMDNGTSAFGAGGYKFLPLPAATADDGVWLMFSNRNAMGEGNFFLAQVTNGIEVTTADRLDENNNYRIDFEWRGTPVFRGATVATAGSAPYIVFEPDVDLA